MKKITIQLAPGFEEIEAITIIDVLRRAEFDVTTVSMTEELKVAGSHDIPIIADKLFSEIDYSSVDMVVLPGGMPGAKNLDEHPELKDLLISFNQNNKYVGAICAAPLVLGHADLLKGKEAVCFPGYEDELKGAEVKYEPTMVSGKIVTGRGAGVAMKFSLKIVELLDSKEKANKLANVMLVENFEA